MAKIRVKGLKVKPMLVPEKVSWKLVTVLILLMLGNFAWDSYNRVDRIKLEVDKVIQQATTKE